MRECYILAQGDYSAVVSGELADLRGEVAKVVGQPVRRISRFIELALLGAGRCLQGRRADAVYLGAAVGDMQGTLDVLQPLVRDRQPPRPNNFINTVSNAACFHIAGSFGLTGRSLCIGHRHFAFESALQLALLDMDCGVESALIGVVETVAPPLAEHCARYGLPAGAAVAEASHWLLLGTQAPTANATQILAAQHLADRAALLDWIANQNLQPCHIAGGQHLPESELATIQQACGLSQRFAYRDTLAHHGSHSAAAIGAFSHVAAPATLLHINTDDSGRYSAFVIHKE